MTHGVLAIANEFLERAAEGEVVLTPMHLQKLCYFAQGFSLATEGAPLTDDRIEAWDFGPVFSVLYDALKRYGSGDVEELIKSNNWASASHVRGEVVRERFTRAEYGLLEGVFPACAQFETFQLSALTHQEGSPWRRMYNPRKKNILIPNGLIKE